MPRPLRVYLRLLPALCASAIGSSLPASAANEPEEPIRVAIVGLVHGHVKGFLTSLAK